MSLASNPAGVERRPVLLGPSFQLHDGIHGALLDNPPSGVTYVQQAGRCRCLFEDTGGFPPNPFDDLSIGETALYDDSAGVVVHSSRLPVQNPVPWIVEHDCLLALLHYGAFFSIGSEARISAGLINPATVRRRQRVILGSHLSSWCQSVLFQTEHSRRTAFEYIEDTDLLGRAGLDRLHAKSDVVYPAMPVTDERSGPQHGERVTILYAGRTFYDKGGVEAVATFSRLNERFGDVVQLWFVGEAPDCIDCPPAIRFRPFLPRNEYLGLLSECHIFFSPTRYESFGMALVEAAAAGLAIVTSGGVGMEHIGELLADGEHAYLVPTELPPDRRVARYVEAISRLVEDPASRKEMAARNRRLVASGKFSLAARDRKLLPHYERMWRRFAQKAQAPNESVEEPGLRPKEFSAAYISLEFARRGGGRVCVPELRA